MPAGRLRQTKQIEDGGGGVREAGDTSHAHGFVKQTRYRDQVRNVDIFFVDKEHMAKVSVMLAERFAVVAADDEEGSVE